MKMLPIVRRLLIACGCALSSFHAFAGDLQLASELVRLARFDFASIHVLRLQAERDAAEGKRAADAANCLRTKSHELFRPVLAKELAGAMTSEELRAAVDFYATPIGQKYTEHGILLFHRNYGFPLPAPLPDIYPSELQAIAAFSKTAAGDKLMFKQVARSAIVSPDSQRLTRELVKECGA